MTLRKGALTARAMLACVLWLSIAFAQAQPMHTTTADIQFLESAAQRLPAIAGAMKADRLAAESAQDNGWMPIKTAPTDALIDVWANGERVVDVEWDGWQWVAHDEYAGVVELTGVTHWRRQPEPPRGVKGRGR